MIPQWHGSIWRDNTYQTWAIQFPNAVCFAIANGYNIDVNPGLVTVSGFNTTQISWVQSGGKSWSVEVFAIGQ